MVNEESLDDAFELAMEELPNPENISREDLRTFRIKLESLLNKLIADCEE